MVIRITQQPADEPVTLAEARRHCRAFVVDPDEDAYIQGLIVAARSLTEAIAGRAWVSRTVEVRLDAFPSTFRLPYTPTLAIDSISYGPDAVLIDPAGYTLEGDLVFPAPAWPSPGPFVVSYQAGYGGPEDVPQAAKLAMQMLVSLWYEQRQPIAVGTIVNKIPYAVEALLSPLMAGVYP